MQVYKDIFSLIEYYIFGGGIVPGSYEELVTILLATIGSIFLISIPFIVVYKVIKLIVG